VDAAHNWLVPADDNPLQPEPTSYTVVHNPEIMSFTDVRLSEFGPPLDFRRNHEKPTGHQRFTDRTKTTQIIDIDITK